MFLFFFRRFFKQ
ncbi:hypothetical protein CAEBREN_29868 [Caenorhabditis brenneri]|uniref:Uncharacterized protein n=1 Tax=Caenorhabditis brenneri TaxID=135651 RepID=G0MXK4_CAEBE|nr:hypothetical protein CAEBREN_29868 [Caenorhabditis brenneri]